MCLSEEIIHSVSIFSCPLYPRFLVEVNIQISKKVKAAYEASIFSWANTCLILSMFELHVTLHALMIRKRIFPDFPHPTLRILIDNVDTCTWHYVSVLLHIWLALISLQYSAMCRLRLQVASYQVIKQVQVRWFFFLFCFRVFNNFLCSSFRCYNHGGLLFTHPAIAILIWKKILAGILGLQSETETTYYVQFHIWVSLCFACIFSCFLKWWTNLCKDLLDFPFRQFQMNCCVHSNRKQLGTTVQWTRIHLLIF